MLQNKQTELLEQYKKYDYLGSGLKIFVSYIKPSFLFKSNILVPIHLGRSIEKEASKDGKISDDDISWLHNNCISDDDFEGNISIHNRRVGFFTGTYKAYKNYKQIGNPEYFGSFGYRRLLSPEFLADIKKYDLILPKKKDLKLETIKEQFSKYHGLKLFDNTINIFREVYTDEYQELEEYFNGTSGYFDEIYIMKRDLFFDFCEWIIPLLFQYIKQPQIALNNCDTRDIGFIIERLTGYYMNKLTRIVRCKEVEICATEKFRVNPSIINRDLLAKLRRNL